jgi:hypothetical protein
MRSSNRCPLDATARIDSPKTRKPKINCQSVSNAIPLVVSPLDKDGPFGEVEHGCKAENKDAVKWRNQKRELKMGFLVPICMLAMIVICAVTLTRL